MSAAEVVPITSRQRPARWTPRRLLLVNVHNYTAQELLFSERGWLLLRGANGSGKSTALEASLPFVLDADLQRFAAASTASRSWRTALLPNPEVRHRTGHVAIEWEGPDGTWLTTGATLDAQVGKAEVDHFHWMTTQRVGVSLARTYLDIGGTHTDALVLVDDDGQPLRIKDIKDLRDDGWMRAQTAKRDEWQGHVNREIFGFADEEDLRRHLRTLHTVRNISRAVEDNNPESFSRRLLDGLPELNASTLADIRDALEGVRRYADDLASATAAARRLTEILDSYRDYVARIVRARTDRLLDARGLAAQTQADRDRLAGKLTDAEAEVERLVSARRNAEVTARGAREAHESLKHSDEAEPARRLTRARTDAERSTNAAEAAEQRAVQDADEYVRADREREQIEAALEGARGARSAATASAARHLREAGGPPIEEVGAIAAAITARRLAAEEQSRLREEEQRVRLHRDAKAADVEVARAEHEACEARRDEAEANSARERETLVGGLIGWAAGPPLNLPADRARAFADERLSGGSDQLDAKLREHTGAVERQLGTLAQQRDDLARSAEQHEHELELARATTDPPVELPGWLTQDDREPLWRVAEFSQQLDDGARDELESALEASGLLFATLGAAQTATATLRSRPRADGPAASGRTVADVLEVGGPDAADWHTILAEIPLGTSTNGRLSVDRSSWMAGPLTVTAAPRPARLIGHAARERARQERIAALESEIGELAGQRAGVEELLVKANDLREALEQQRQARPPDADLQSALQAAKSAEAVLVSVAARAVKAEEDARLAGAALAAAATARTAHAAVHGLSGDLKAVREQLDEAERHVRLAREQDTRIDGPDGLSARYGVAVDSAARWTQRAGVAREHADAAAAEASTADRVLQQLQASIGEAAAAFDARLSVLERTWEDAEREAKSLESEHAQARDLVTSLSVRLESADRDLERHQATAATALRDFHALDDEGVFAVIAERVNAVVLVGPEGRDSGVLNGIDLDLLLADIVAGSSRFPAADPTRSRQRVEELVRSAQAHTTVTHTTVLGDVLWVFRPDAEGGTSLRCLHERTLADRERYEELFNEGQRRLVEDHLMRHLAGHLQHRLGEARDLIDMQNQVLRGKQTTSGVAVKLRLDLREDIEPELRSLYDLLDPRRGSVDAMEQADRQQIMDAFANAIGLVSSEHWQAAGGLETLLDYRGWLRVDLYEVGVLARRKGVGELRISRQVSGLGSGGERAWMIYMPLLAALSGQADRTEHGPKIVPMDEALAKVDRNGAEEFFNALSDFGMSCMLTSEKLSPTSPRQGSLSSYQCETVSDTVFVMHTYWDADRRQRLEDSADQLAIELLC